MSKPMPPKRNSAPGASAADMINHPPHYTSYPSGVECIQVAEHFNFCVGSAIKYLWRAGLKWDAVEDLKKAVWFINREIARREQPNVEVSEGGTRDSRIETAAQSRPSLH